jgi:prenyl protein peptidase
LSKATLTTVIFGTPIIFGLAHAHHFYEFRITHLHTPIIAAILRSVFQLAYTTLFGAYATFLYLRTGSLLAVILAHAFCNWMGLPRFWGRVGAIEPLVGPDNGQEQARKRDEDKATAAKVKVADGRLGIAWTVVYYVILVAGAFGFWKELWTLTESSSALIQFFEARHAGLGIE